MPVAGIDLGGTPPLIRWGSGPVCFELRSPDRDIIEAAQHVFGKWHASGDATLEGEWEVRRSGDEILIDPMPEHPDGGVLPVFRDVGHAITCVE